MGTTVDRSASEEICQRLQPIEDHSACDRSDWTHECATANRVERSYTARPTKMRDHVLPNGFDRSTWVWAEWWTEAEMAHARAATSSFQAGRQVSGCAYDADTQHPIGYEGARFERVAFGH